MPLSRDQLDRCWNCWKTGHECRVCPESYRTYEAKEALRIKLGIPLPRGPKYEENILYPIRGCFNCWRSLSHRTENCPEKRGGVFEREELRKRLCKPFYRSWERILRDAQRQRARQPTQEQQLSISNPPTSTANMQPVPASTPKNNTSSKVPSEASSIFHCWNCWSTSHETLRCPRPKVLPSEADSLRVDLGMPRPRVRLYEEFLAWELCTNCWETDEHRTGLCPGLSLNISEREVLRARSSVPLTVKWVRRLASSGLDPLTRNIRKGKTGGASSTKTARLKNSGNVRRSGCLNASVRTQQPMQAQGEGTIQISSDERGTTDMVDQPWPWALPDYFEFDREDQPREDTEGHDHADEANPEGYTGATTISLRKGLLEIGKEVELMRNELKMHLSTIDTLFVEIQVAV